MKLTIKKLTLSLWNDLEALFGKNGACGGCWCMSWRRIKGENWDDVKGDINKNRFKKLVQEKKVHGAIAYTDGKPIGWVSFDRREDFIKLDRSPSLKCDDAKDVWSIPCFYIHKDYRKKNVGTELLAFAVKTLKKSRAKIIEGYPVKSYSMGKDIPAAFAWTGTIPLFKKAGFLPVGPRDGGKQRMRLHLMARRFSAQMLAHLAVKPAIKASHGRMK